MYIVEGPSGGVCVKQALPYVRCVGEAWPLTQVGAQHVRSSEECSRRTVGWGLGEPLLRCSAEVLRGLRAQEGQGLSRGKARTLEG